VIKPRYDYSLTDTVERDEAEIFHKAAVAVRDPHAERAEFLAALRSAHEAEEKAAREEAEKTEMAIERKEGSNGGGEFGVEGQQVEISDEEEEEWEVIGEREAANLSGELLAVLFADYASSSSSWRNHEQQQDGAVEMDEGDKHVRRKRRKFKIGTYDEGTPC
jgi:hypothetical protein